MATCDTCGNDYDRTFTITRGEASGTYDSLECAIQAWAPGCAHCGCRILGHGVETPQGMYCCAHCARSAGAEGPADRVVTGSGRGGAPTDGGSDSAEPFPNPL